MPELTRIGRGLSWRVDAAVRTLPDFLIVGAQKAGTTTLYSMLLRSPGVLSARKKEVRFFDRHWDRGTLWYRWFFPTLFATSLPGRRRLTGEATPDYLPNPDVPRRVKETLPRCRVIVMLRDPVARAYSQYRMNLELGEEERSFREAVDAELQRLDCSELESGWTRERLFHSYVERSRYAPQLRRWFDALGRQSVHVMTLEDLRENPARELDAVTEFLGAPPIADKVLEVANFRRYPPLDPRDRNRLAADFEADMAATAELLARDLPYGP